MKKVVIKFSDGTHFNQTATRMERIMGMQGNFYIEVYNEDTLVAFASATDISGIYMSESQSTPHGQESRAGVCGWHYFDNNGGKVNDEF